jgi:hypothetical protein
MGPTLRVIFAECDPIDCDILGCDTVWSYRSLQTFQGNPLEEHIASISRFTLTLTMEKVHSSETSVTAYKTTGLHKNRNKFACYITWITSPG